MNIFESCIGTDHDLNHVLEDQNELQGDLLNCENSKYISMSDIKSIFNGNCNDFAILTLNTQSINAKFNTLFPIIDNLSAAGSFFGAICLQETWLDDSADVSLLQLPGYRLIHQGRKCSKHGGLMIYLHDAYSYKIRDLYNTSRIWEGQFIDVTGPRLNRPLTIGNIYRPPHNNNSNDHIQNFLTEITPILDVIQKENSYAALVGDFNINLLHINEREKFAEYFDLFCTNNFLPKITLPTRFSTRSCSLIDQIFCKVPTNKKVELTSAIIVSNISDHLPCVVNFKILRQNPVRPKYIQHRDFSALGLNKFREGLIEKNITSILNKDLMSDPNTDYEIYEKILTSCFDSHFPEKVVKVNKYKHKLSPWITQGIIKSIEFRDNLYKKTKIVPVDTLEYYGHKHNLKMYNKYLNSCIRCAKKDYYSREFIKYKNDSRKTWDTLKNVINKHRVKSQFPTHFLNNGNKVIGNEKIADLFNKYFTEIGPILANSIDSSNKPTVESYLTRPCSASFHFEYTTPESVEKIISNFKPKTSAGHDNISSKLLRDIKDIISSPLSLILNQSLCTGIFPDKLKVAKVIPLYKKGDDKLFGNYRPISLLTSTSKVFERVVFEQIYDYFTSNHLFYDNQYGFRKGHSTELAATELIDRIRKQMDDGKSPFSIFLDLSKAFDTLDHNILLNKLQYYGIHGAPLNWFKSYLTNRHQFIDLNGTKSPMREILTGVPQGSILGPLLFIIYMNDVHVVSKKFNFILFADDTTTLGSMCSFTLNQPSKNTEISDNINGELAKLSDWLAVNKLSLNAAKTKFMMFRYPQKIISNVPNLMINNSPIGRVTEFNFLGLVINEFLTWTNHISKIGNKISRTVGIMNRLKRILPTNILKLMYDSLILSQLQFGITAWGFECHRITKLQKRAIRTLTNSKYNAHTEPLFKEHKLLKVSDIFNLKCMNFWYKFINGTLPKYFENIFVFKSELCQRGTRTRNTLYAFPTRTTGARNCVRHYIPEVLKLYPPNIIERAQTHSIESYSSHIKSSILESYKYGCIVVNCYICSN